MQATLTDINRNRQYQKLLISLAEDFKDVTDVEVTFIESSTGMVITIPAKPTEELNVVQVEFDIHQLVIESEMQTDLNWQIFVGFESDQQKQFLHVESEYFGSKHLLSLSNWFQINVDDDNFANVHIRMHEPTTEFNTSSVNLKDGQLLIRVHQEVNSEPLENQQIFLVANHATETRYKLNRIEEATVDGLAVHTLNLETIGDWKDTYRLEISHDFEGRRIKQRLVSYYLQKTRSIVMPWNSYTLNISPVESNSLVLKAIPQPGLISRVSNKIARIGVAGNIISDVYMKIKRRYLKRLFKMQYTPYDQTTIVFESFGGRQVSDSPRAIYDEFRRTYPNIKLIWSVNKEAVKECKENGFDYVVRESAAWVRTLEKSQFWISNARFPGWVRKPKRITFIQTWHGTPLKKLGLDMENVEMPGTTTEAYHKNFVKEANRWDALVSPNDYSSTIFRNAFGYHNQILKVGYPRNDKLMNYSDETIEVLKENMGIPKYKKVVLYAPTYRDNQFFEKGKYSFELPFSLDEFRDKFGKDTILILRMHYLISNALDISDYEDFVYDLSSYPNISDLYLVSDLLITDYSSVFFDYAYLKRPILFYPYDYHLYKDELRGFYLDYEKDLPGDIVFDGNELMAQVDKTLQKTSMQDNEKFMKFYKRFCSINSGTSSEKIVNYVMAKLQ